MADEKTEEGQGPLQLGRRHEEVEPERGRRHQGTGRPVLLWVLADHVIWKPTNPWEVRPPVRPVVGMGIATATLTGLALGLSAWLFVSCPLGLTNFRAPDVETEAAFLAEAPFLNHADIPAPTVPSSPVPTKPFDHQATAPCTPRSEVELNGGCWMELAQTPPCEGVVAEHRGRCFVPVSKDWRRGRPPQDSGP